MAFIIWSIWCIRSGPKYLLKEPNRTEFYFGLFGPDRIDRISKKIRTEPNRISMVWFDFSVSVRFFSPRWR